MGAVMKNLLLLLLLTFNFSQAWATENDKTLDELYDLIPIEKRADFKERLKDLGWMSVAESNEADFLVNYSYLTNKPNNQVEGWTKVIIINDISKDGLSLNDFTMYLDLYNCNNQTTKKLSYTDYNHKTGSVIKSHKYPTYTDFEGLIPETIGVKLFKAVCSLAYVKSN